MIRKVNTCIVTGFGINADSELGYAFELAGSQVTFIHAADLFQKPESLLEHDILAFPGGFSFGDHLGSGLVLAGLVRKNLRHQMQSFVKQGGLVIGICNGFQVLVKSGLLPNLVGDWSPQVSLMHNESGIFNDSWVAVHFEEDSVCLWTEGLNDTELPVRHGEGRFVTQDGKILEELNRKHLIALRYSHRNPNGSVEDIAGITDPSGRILGLMPHPEAFIHKENHPHWRRLMPMPDPGIALFRRGVTVAKGDR